MKKGSLLLLFLLVLVSCESKRVVEEFTLEKRLYQFDHEIRQQLERDTVPWKGQVAVSKYTAKGNYAKALKEWDKVFRSSGRSYEKERVDSLRNKYISINAKEAIVEEAKKRKVTIINEAHHNSFHRRFVTTLLKDLYDQGYRHLGLEALDNTKNKDTLLNERGYPLVTSGYYTQDPNFSLFIREAIRMGYQVFPYEQNTGAQNKFREIEQAKNIAACMNKYPEDKFLIYCGFDHVLEGDYGRQWEKAMAERLKEYTQEDPLTIHQTAYSQRSSKDKNHPLLKAFDPEKSVVLKDQKGDFLGYVRGNATTDMAVFHPEPETVNGRLISRNASQKELDLKDLKLKFPSMLWVFEETDDIRNVVPIYIGEVLEAQESVIVPLTSGRYSFAFVQENNQVLTFKDKI